MSLTDDDFEEAGRVIWEIEASGAAPGSNATFVIGHTPSGFRQVTALEEPLKPDDNVHLVVTSLEVGSIPMSFVVEDVRVREVFVRRTRYRDPDDFASRAADSCPST